MRSIIVLRKRIQRGVQSNIASIIATICEAKYQESLTLKLVNTRGIYTYTDIHNS